MVTNLKLFLLLLSIPTFAFSGNHHNYFGKIGDQNNINLFEHALYDLLDGKISKFFKKMRMIPKSEITSIICDQYTFDETVLEKIANGNEVENQKLKSDQLFALKYNNLFVNGDTLFHIILRTKKIGIIERFIDTFKEGVNASLIIKNDEEETPLNLIKKMTDISSLILESLETLPNASDVVIPSRTEKTTYITPIISTLEQQTITTPISTRMITSLPQDNTDFLPKVSTDSQHHSRFRRSNSNSIRTNFHSGSSSHGRVAKIHHNR